jgi:hypothetical protein
MVPLQDIIDNIKKDKALQPIQLPQSLLGQEDLCTEQNLMAMKN